MSKVTKFFRGKVRSVDPKTYTAEVVISNEGLDRYKERVLVTSFKKTIKDFMEHPVLLSSHAYRGLMNQIGEFTKIKIDNEAKEVVAYPKWYVGEGNPEADWGWKLAEKGIAAFSIGFIPKKVKNNDTDEERKEAGGSHRDYEEIELLETSQVLIPALRTALQRSFESDDEEIRQLAADILEAMEKDLPDETPVVEEKDGDAPEGEIEDKGWEETENEIRHRLKDPGLFDKFRYAGLKKSKPRVNAIYGKYKGKTEWAIQSLRFPKEDGWTIDSAKSWLKEHPIKTVPNEQEVDAFEKILDVELQLDAISLMLVDVKAYALQLLETKGVELNAELHAAEGIVPDPMLAEVKAKVEELLLRLAPPEKKDPPEAPAEVPEVSEENDLVDSVMSEEKLLEIEENLRRSLSTDKGIDVESVKNVLDNITAEVSRAFSGQPKGHGKE